MIDHQCKKSIENKAASFNTYPKKYYPGKDIQHFKYLLSTNFNFHNCINLKIFFANIINIYCYSIYYYLLLKYFYFLSVFLLKYIGCKPLLDHAFKPGELLDKKVVYLESFLINNMFFHL